MRGFQSRVGMSLISMLSVHMWSDWCNLRWWSWHAHTHIRNVSLHSQIQTYRYTYVQCFLTLGTCARVMVVVCVCYRTSCYIPCLYVENKVPLAFFMVFSRYALCGFHWKHFVQKFWRHLLNTSAFFASWLLDELSIIIQKKQRWLLFKKTSV